MTREHCASSLGRSFRTRLDSHGTGPTLSFCVDGPVRHQTVISLAFCWFICVPRLRTHAAVCARTARHARKTLRTFPHARTTHTHAHSKAAYFRTAGTPAHATLRTRAALRTLHFLTRLNAAYRVLLFPFSIRAMTWQQLARALPFSSRWNARQGAPRALCILRTYTFMARLLCLLLFFLSRFLLLRGACALLRHHQPHPAGTADAS